MKKTLIIFGHRTPSESIFGKTLFESTIELASVPRRVLLDEYRPDVMSVEQLFFNRNVTTAISVGQARGVALLTAANRGIQITEFTPMEIKQAVVGYGGANKEQVTFMVQKLLNIRTKPKPDDVADALAVAICGLHTAATRRWQELK